MPFPQAPIVDNFDRADEGPPPGSGWITPLGLSGCVTLDNQMQPDPLDAHDGTATWNNAGIGPACETFLTLSQLHVDQILPGSSYNGPIVQCWLGSYYEDPLNAFTGHRFDLYYDTGTGSYDIWITSATPYGSRGHYGPFTAGVGDQFGYGVSAGSVFAYYKPAGDAWSRIILESSGSYGAGYPVIHIARLLTDDSPVTYTPAAAIDDFGVATIPDTGEYWLPQPPTCLLAQVSGSDVHLTWHNSAEPYLEIWLERSADQAGPFEWIDITIEPDAEEATDVSPPALDLWYQVGVYNDYGDAYAGPVQAMESVRAAWNTVAHAMGIEDLFPPPAPFRFGEAGELFFLVCCRLWRMEVTAGLPDPVGTDPVDWREFIETGTYPTP